MSRKRKSKPPVTEKVVETVTRLTCERCAWLRRYPSPMCRNERSPRFRQYTDTYHQVCEKYSLEGARVVEPPKPEAPPVSRAAIAGEVAKKKYNRWSLRDGVLYVSVSKEVGP